MVCKYQSCEANVLILLSHCVVFLKVICTWTSCFDTQCPQTHTSGSVWGREVRHNDPVSEFSAMS